MKRMRKELRLPKWLLLIAVPVLLLIVLELARYYWLASTLWGYASYAVPLIWAIAEVVLVTVAVGLVAYCWWAGWRTQGERVATETRTLHETTDRLQGDLASLAEGQAVLRSENNTLRDQSMALQATIDVLKQEKAVLQETLDTLHAQPSITFVKSDHLSLLRLLLEGQLTEEEALDYVAQTAQLLASFHTEGTPYVLAPDTVVVDRDSREAFLRQRLIGVRADTTFYASFSPPEALGNPPTTRADVFSLGALLYALYTHQMPPAGDDLVLALDHLNVSSGYLGVDYLLRKALWPQAQFRLETASEFGSLLQRIVERTRRGGGTQAPAIAFDVGADFNVGLRKGRNRGRDARDNEDRLFWDMDEERCLCLLTIADGVTRSDIGTGYGAAEVFADQAVQLWQTLRRDPKRAASPNDTLVRLFMEANHRIVRSIAKQLRGRAVDSDEATMAAAACAALCDGSRATIANLGDVRAYLATSNWVSKVTHDHSALSELLHDPSLSPEEWTAVSGSTLSGFLGRWEHGPGGEINPVKVEPHLVSLTLAPGEALVLASDGAYHPRGGQQEPFEDTLLKILQSTQDAQVAAFRLMSVANQRSGGDNISCIVCRCTARDIQL